VTPAGRVEREPWRIEFFQRHVEDDATCATPAVAFLEELPTAVAAEIHAILAAVAAAPPPSFSGGGKWEAMHGKMAGIFEVRVGSRGKNYRLFCLLVRSDRRLAGPSIVCLDGIAKPARSAARPQDYERIKQFAAEFEKRGWTMS
jgi:hypothetical protein